jgi:hypothetical protein
MRRGHGEGSIDNLTQHPVSNLGAERMNLTEQDALQSTEVVAAPDEESPTPTRTLPFRRAELKDDIREGLCNDCPIGPAAAIQLPLESITRLQGIVIDLDPEILRPDNPIFPPADVPAAFYGGIQPVLERHPLVRHAEIRASGRGLHVILRIDPPVELRSHGEQRYWNAIVKGIQRTLPSDPLAPGITALTRPLGAINSKNNCKVELVKAGSPIRPEAIVDFMKTVASSSFLTVGRILLGGDRVERCPRCCESALSLHDHHGQCYTCGKVRLIDLFDAVFRVPNEGAPGSVSKSKRKPSKA